MSFLTDIATPTTRRRTYAAYSTLGLLIGAVQAGFGALDAAAPDWLKVTLAVYAFLGTAIGATAASNVRGAGPVTGDPGVTRA